MVERNASTSRLSAIGLGQGGCTALISGIARAGNGRALFVRDEYVLFFSLSTKLSFSSPHFVGYAVYAHRGSRAHFGAAVSIGVGHLFPQITGVLEKNQN